MQSADHKSELCVTMQADGLVKIEGELSLANADEFRRRLEAITVESDQEITLDLHGFDIEDGVALATTIDALRGLRSRAAGLVLTGAPQMLGHNLYRVGMLGGGDAVTLVDMRLDEPAGF